MNKGVAVLDFGSARLKMRIAENVDGKIENIFHVADTFMKHNLDKDNNLPDSYIENTLLPEIKKCLEKAQKHNCKAMLSIGTHVFREMKNSEYVLGRIREYIGDINIISGEVEGEVFFERMNGLVDEKDFILMEVGAGSVQLMADNGETCCSMPCGTTSLMKLYQKAEDKAENSELEQMGKHIFDTIEKSWKSKKNEYKLLVFGTNFMEGLVNSLVEKSNSKELKKGYRQVFNLNEIEEVYNEIKCRPYVELEPLYPPLPSLMWGADKCLLNVISAAKKLGINKIMPTNESGVSALVSILMSKPEELEKKGLKVFKL